MPSPRQKRAAPAALAWRRTESSFGSGVRNVDPVDRELDAVIQVAAGIEIGHVMDPQRLQCARAVRSSQVGWTIAVQAAVLLVLGQIGGQSLRVDASCFVAKAPVAQNALGGR